MPAAAEPIPNCPPGCRLLPLTRGKFAIVDECDWERLSRWKWSATPSSTSDRLWYAKRTGRTASGKSRNVSLHREIMGVVDQPDVILDHRNGNGLDNRRANLRTCTQRKNTFNRRPNSSGTSRFKGVSRKNNNQANPWRAQIRMEGRRIHLGYFCTQEEAAKAYDEAARRLFGAFAYANF